MIPKIIHYVWLGHGEQSETIRKCIQSWHEILPEYEIKCWDETNFDIDNAPSFVKEAYENKYWAFASDYVRLWVLNQYGGIYLDTDVEVKKSLTPFLCHRLFIGTQVFEVQESKTKIIQKTNLSIGVIGCEQGHPFIRECLEYYKDSGFVNKSDMTEVSNYQMARLLARFGYINEDKRQSLTEGIEVYTSITFADRLQPNEALDCYTYHWGEMSWYHPKPRGLFYKICWRLNLMQLYRWIEQLRKK